MTSRRDMTIPKSQSEVILGFAFTTVVLSFVVLAIVNVLNGVALIASCVWLALVALMIWVWSKDAGGFRLFLMEGLGALFGRRFVECDSPDRQPREVHFGFELFGHRFIQHRIGIESIESVEWNSGQATHWAGRDMNDWSVFLWFDHNDPAETERQRMWRHRKPDQDVYVVGPSTRKDRTEALGLSFVEFLRAAGVDLIQGANSACFSRQTLEEEERKFFQPTDGTAP